MREDQGYFELLVQCYKSGQMEHHQWEDHKTESTGFRQWLQDHYPELLTEVH